MFNFQISLDQLQDENPHVQLAACDDIARLESDIPQNLIEPIVRQLVSEIEDVAQDFRIRREAIIALGALGPRARSAGSTLLELLGEQDEELRTEAFLALDRTGFDPVEYAQAFHTALIEQNSPTLATLSFLLGKYTGASEELLDDFLYGLSCEGSRQICIDNIYLVTPPERYSEVTQALVEAAQEGDVNQKASALRVIERMGRLQDEAIEALRDEVEQALQIMDQERGPEISLREKAAWFNEPQNFCAEAEQNGLDAIISRCAEDDWKPSRIADGLAEVVRHGNSGNLRLEALRRLMGYLDATEPDVRIVGLQALRELEFRAYPALPQITSLLQDPSDSVILEARKTFDVVRSSYIPEQGPV